MRTPTKYVLCLLVLLLIIGLSAIPAQSQEPCLAVYFDDCTTRETACGTSGLGEICFVVENANTFLSTVEFSIEYPPCMTYLGDIHLPGALYLGVSPTGVTITYPVPMSGWEPLVVAKALVWWNCASAGEVEIVRTAPHPGSGELCAIEFRTYRVISLAPQNSYIGSIAAKMDIKPGSCPNPFNLELFDAAAGANPRKGGVLPVAIVGTDDFDVSQVDVSTIRLEGVAPLALGGGPRMEDVTTPVADLADCNCNRMGPDGILDLTMKFSGQEIAAAITAGDPGEERVLTLHGYLLDGTPFDAQDCIVFVGRDPAVPYGPKPEQTVLYDVFPSPFNPATRIRYAVAEAGVVSLSVYDVRGRLLTELVNGNKAAGEYVVEWNAGDLPSGIYFFRLVAGDVRETKKAVLVK